MAVISGIAAPLVAATFAPPDRGRVASVTDGDTFRLESGERIRIANIDAPETQEGNARCRAELERGQAAKRQARMLLECKMVTIERVGRSYNRSVARVQLEGRDVGAALVAMNATRWWPRGQTKPDWCAGRR